MPMLQLPGDFQNSCLKSGSYPTNLIHRGTNIYSTPLKAYRDRLIAAEAALFVEDEEQIEVPIRDLGNESGEELEKRRLHNAAILTSWLGLETALDANNAGQSIVSATKRDPKCRFIYLYGEHSRAKLRITKDMLTQLLSYHQVIPVYLDFIFVFGARSDPLDLRFSGFRQQMTLSESMQRPAVSSLGRSGRQYQLCYNLKGVTLRMEDKTNHELDDWSIRQVAIHHQFDVVNGTTLWIITKGHTDILDRFKTLTGPNGEPESKSFGTVEQCFRSSLAAHLLYCHWSTEGWRWYIRWLESVIDKGTALTVFDLQELESSHQQLKLQHIQDLLRWEDRNNQFILVLEANVDVMSSLSSFYTALITNKEVPSGLGSHFANDIAAFSAQVRDMIYDFKMQITRAKFLVKITKDKKELVVQDLQRLAANQQILAAGRMERLSRNMEKEATVVRIITIVTLVYLPATVVSTFFSTDIVKYQNQNGEEPSGGTFSKMAMYRWLQVTLPLTALTLVISWMAFHFAESERTDHVKKRESKQDTETTEQKIMHDENGFYWKIHNYFQSGDLPLLPIYNKAS